MTKAGNKLGVPGLARGLSAIAGKVDLAHLPAQAWIDGKGRVRKFTYTLTVPVAGTTISSEETLQFSNFGEPVDVVAPAASDVVPFTQVPDFFTQLGTNASSS
jgi:hypothetical protein